MIITPRSCPILQNITFVILFEVISQFFSEYSHRKRILNFCFITVVLIHFPCDFKRNAIVFHKFVIRIQNKIIKVITSVQHYNWNVFIIFCRITQIDIFTLIRNCSKFKIYLFSQSIVFLLAYLLTSR